ncbi:MAG: ATP-binding protein [Candidatus Marinamargulisbacteria bacterium]
MSTPLNTIALLIDPINIPEFTTTKHTILNEIQRCSRELKKLYDRFHHLDHQQKDTHLLPVIHSMTSSPSNITINSAVKNDQPIKKTAAELIRLLLDVLIENALDANASHITIDGRFEYNYCQIMFTNNGPPLPSEITHLMRFGQSSHRDSPHIGMGLFLVRLILENLDGSIYIHPSNNVALTLKIPQTSLC